jgi:hypothetical protein
LLFHIVFIFYQIHVTNFCSPFNINLGTALDFEYNSS